MAQTSLLLQTRWDWASAAASNKFGPSTQLYRNNYNTTVIADGFPIIVTKNKVRGKGRALQLRFTSETGKDAELVGWGIWINKGTRP